MFKCSHLLVCAALISGAAAQTTETAPLGTSSTAPPSNSLPPGATMKDVTPSKMIGRTHDCTSYYPGLSSPFRESGEALIQYDVGADGTISNVLLLKSSGFPEIDGAALACVREQWRNTPAYVKDVPIATPGHRAIVRFTMH